MCSLSDHIVEGILNYSLIPYAEQNNIEIADLIKKLSDYHNEKMVTKKPKKKLKLNLKKGRPTGSKNKTKDVQNKEDTVSVKKPKGRPTGSSNNKHIVLDVGL